MSAMPTRSRNWLGCRPCDEPELALDWTLAEWERVVRLARRLRLLARLAEGSDGCRLARTGARRRRAAI